MILLLVVSVKHLFIFLGSIRLCIFLFKTQQMMFSFSSFWFQMKWFHTSGLLSSYIHSSFWIMIFIYILVKASFNSLIWWDNMQMLWQTWFFFMFNLQIAPVSNKDIKIYIADCSCLIRSPQLWLYLETDAVAFSQCCWGMLHLKVSSRV